jgi:hypothetical protein
LAWQWRNPAGPARTDCYIGLSRINRQKSEISAGVAQQQAATAIYRTHATTKSDCRSSWCLARQGTCPHFASLGQRELAHSADRSRLGEYQARLAEIESAVRTFKVARPFEIDLHRLKIHLRMVQEDVSRMAAVN